MSERTWRLSEAMNISGHAVLEIGTAKLHIFILREGEPGSAKMRIEAPGRNKEKIVDTAREMHAMIGVFMHEYGSWKAED